MNRTGDITETHTRTKVTYSRLEASRRLLPVRNFLCFDVSKRARAGAEAATPTRRARPRRRLQDSRARRHARQLSPPPARRRPLATATAPPRLSLAARASHPPTVERPSRRHSAAAAVDADHPRADHPARPSRVRPADRAPPPRGHRLPRAPRDQVRPPSRRPSRRSPPQITPLAGLDPRSLSIGLGPDSHRARRTIIESLLRGTSCDVANERSVTPRRTFGERPAALDGPVPPRRSSNRTRPLRRRRSRRQNLDATDARVDGSNPTPAPQRTPMMIKSLSVPSDVL
jgi:hypothetical protein